LVPSGRNPGTCPRNRLHSNLRNDFEDEDDDEDEYERRMGMRDELGVA